MESEQEIFGLMTAAKDQQAAVERALLELARERKATAQHNAAFFRDADRLLGDFRLLKDQLAREAASGIQNAVADVAGQVAAPIKAEMQTTVKSVQGIRDSLENGARWLSWRWIIGCMVAAFFAGFVVSWAMYQRSLETLANQISVIQQNTSQPQLPSQRATRRGR